MLLALIPAEPTGPPNNVTIRWIKKRAAKLSWKAIACPDQNGRILRYLIRHDYELPNGAFAEDQSETGELPNGTFAEQQSYITHLNLRPNRNYSVQVAGVNDAGVGTFSPPIKLVTPGGSYTSANINIFT